jgi:hypothetical protein
LLPAVAVPLLLLTFLIAYFARQMSVLHPLLVYTSPEGRFRVTFPAAPGNMNVATQVAPSDFGPFVFHAIGRDSTRIHADVYAVTYCDPPAAFLDITDGDQRFNFSLRLLKDAYADFTETSSRTVSKGRYPGRAWNATLNINGIRCKGTFYTYLAGPRIYWLEFFRAPNAAPSDASIFFDSFEILDKPAAQKPSRSTREPD